LVASYPNALATETRALFASPFAISAGSIVARKWRTQQKVRKRVPIVTCIPWKPVVMKKIEP
jgi:hypothetical protein